jgi:hypothetical protein
MLRRCCNDFRTGDFGRRVRQNVSLFLSKKRLTPLLGCSKLNIIPWHPAFDCKIARCADLSSQVKMAVRALVGFVLTVPHAALGQSTSIWDTLDARLR